MTRQYNDVGTYTTKGVVKDTTPEERRSAIRAVCGSNGCTGAKDAAFLLKVLGLNPGEKFGGMTS
jgi:hypothetical protein